MTPPRHKDEFSSKLSELRHDLRTPVGHVIGYAEMIEEDLAPDLAKLFSGDLQAIQNAGHKMLALIDDHLGAARTSSDDIDVSDAQFQFRMQLNHVTGYGEILHEEALDTDNEELIDDLKRITDAGKVALALVDIIPQRLVEGKPKRQPQTSETSTGPLKSEPVLITSQIGQGGEILVVDDDAANRDLLCLLYTSDAADE